MAMMQNGELTEGIVKAGNSVLDEALRRNEDPRIISSLEDAVALLNSAQSMASAPAGLRIADECANMMLAHGSPQAARVSPHLRFQTSAVSTSHLPKAQHAALHALLPAPHRQQTIAIMVGRNPSQWPDGGEGGHVSPKTTIAGTWG